MKYFKKKINKLRGFTLLEVLIFVTIFSLFFVTAVSIATVILNNLKIQEHKILAVRYSQELLEWLKGKKEENWNDFVNRAGITEDEKIYCFKQTPISDWPPEGLCNSDYNGLYPPIFKRWVLLKKNSQSNPTQIFVKIYTQWLEANRLFQVPLESILTIWE